MRAGPALLFVLLLSLPVASAGASVKVMGGYFDPPSLEIVAGDEVTWVSEDRTAHTITSAWDSGLSFDAVLYEGDAFSWTFSDPGTFTVHCRPHSGMNMTVTVLGALETGASIASADSAFLGPLIALIFGVFVGTGLSRQRARAQR